MRLPVIQGIIRRRILANFRVDPETMQREIPARFRPKLQNGFAVAGICLIRLEHIRPMSMPEIIGLNSENAAHRVAVSGTKTARLAKGFSFRGVTRALRLATFWADASFRASIITLLFW